MVAAGHETTVSLIVNAVVNLSAHPEQRAPLLSGQADWSSAIEGTLRYSPPSSHVLIRFATEDVPVGGELIPAGDALIVSYGAIGRDEQAHGATAGHSTSPAQQGTGTSPSATVRTSAPVRPSPAWRQEWHCRPCTPASPTSLLPAPLGNCATSPW